MGRIFCYENDYFLKLLTLLVIVNTIRQVFTQVSETICFFPRKGDPAGIQNFRCAFIVAINYTSASTPNDCYDPYPATTCTLCKGSDCAGIIFHNDTGETFSSLYSNLKQMAVYKDTFCSVVDLNMTSLVFDCFTSTFGDIRYYSVAYLVRYVFDCRQTQFMRTCRFSQTLQNETFMIFAVFYAVIFMVIILYGIPRYNNLIYETLSAFSPCPLYFLKPIYCHPFHHKLLETSIIYDLVEGEDEIDHEDDFFFTETESKRIHAEYRNITLEISVYDYHKDVTEIIKMSVSRKKKSFLIRLFKKCRDDKYIWPVEKYIPYRKRLHYMSIKDLTDRVKNMDKPALKVIHSEWTQVVA